MNFYSITRFIYFYNRCEGEFSWDALHNSLICKGLQCKGAMYRHFELPGYHKWHVYKQQSLNLEK